MVVVLLGLPLNQLLDLVTLLVGGVLIFGGSVRLTVSRWILGAALVAVALGVKVYTPQLKIEEGHNIFITNGPGQPLEKELPTPVFESFNTAFHGLYSMEKDCAVGRCWRGYPVPEQAFAWSADGVWQTPKYSRTVSTIDFSNQTNLRLGNINNIRFNYATYTSDAGHVRIHRKRLPFYVMYEFPEEAIGGKLCWTGHVFLEEGGDFKNISDRTRSCRVIKTPVTRVYGLSLEPKSPLRMDFVPPDSFKMGEIVRKVATYGGVLLLLLFLLQRPAWSSLGLPFSSVGATLLTTVSIRPELLLGFPYHGGGGDGLTHEGWGRQILQYALKGDFAKALEGMEPAFYYMPGLRYFRAFERLVFGETNYGSFIILAFLALTIFYVLRALLPRRWALGAYIAFGFTPIFERLGSALYLYVQQTRTGHAETIGHTAFFLGMGLILNTIEKKKAHYAWYGFWANMCFAVSIMMRPNFIVGSGIFLSFAMVWLLSQGRFRDFILSSLGFLPFFLMPLHNWIFGGQLVLMTTASTIKMNLTAPPSVYLAMAQEIFSGTFQGPALKQISHQLYSWNKWQDFYRFLPLGVTLVAAFRRDTEHWVRGLAWTALGMQGILIFYVPSGRYAYLAWSLCMMVFVIMLERKIVPFFKKKWGARREQQSPQQSQSI